MPIIFEDDIMYDHAGSRNVLPRTQEIKQNLRARVWRIVRLLPPHIYTHIAASRLDALLQSDERRIDTDKNPETLISSNSESYLWTLEQRALEEIGLSDQIMPVLRAFDQAGASLSRWMNDARASVDVKNDVGLMKDRLSAISKNIGHIDRARTLLKRGQFLLGYDVLKIGAENSVSLLRHLERWVAESFSEDHPVFRAVTSVLERGGIRGEPIILAIDDMKREADMIVSDALYRLERIEAQQK